MRRARSRRACAMPRSSAASTASRCRRCMASTRSRSCRASRAGRSTRIATGSPSARRRVSRCSIPRPTATSRSRAAARAPMPTTCRRRTRKARAPPRRCARRSRARTWTPADIGYVNLHGTASRANDAAEDIAVQAVLGDRVPAGSTKGWTGHALGAAGIVEAVDVPASRSTDGWIPGTLELPDRRRADPVADRARSARGDAVRTR